MERDRQRHIWFLFCFCFQGEITVGGGLDRELKDVYTLSVTAFDNPVSGISLHTSKQIEISVLDVNDHSPEFHPSNTAIVGKIVETAMKGDKVSDISPEIKVTDQDLGQNSELTYQLTPMGNFSLFTVNETTGSLLVNSNLTGMAEVYSYILTVTDGGDPPLSATANVTITVIDVNLNAPQFVNIGPVPAVPEVESFRCFDHLGMIRSLNLLVQQINIIRVVKTCHAVFW